MIIDDLIRQINRLQQQVDGLILPEKSPDLISPFLDLPGLVVFCPMSSVQRSTGNAYDMSGQNRILTYNGNPTYNYSGTVPYIDLDGVGDYLSRADETDLDILGTEAIFAAGVRGLTLGGYFWVDTLPAAGNFSWLIAKDNNAGNRPYTMFLRNTGLVAFRVSDSAATSSINTSIAMATGAWYFLVGRFVPGVSVDVYINNIKASLAAGVVANSFNGADNFTIGAVSGGTYPLDGRASHCFLCANQLSDAIISSLFQQTRGAFGI